MNFKKVIVTGGSGFIGSNFLNYMVSKYKNSKFLNIDDLTYASNSKYLKIKKKRNYFFKKTNIIDYIKVKKIFKKFNPDLVVHFAAESHVDRSILSSKKFIETNILGTFNILRLINKNIFLIHISTDEVYGEVKNNKKFSEKTPYDPRSPYSSSKAAADHLVNAWNNTYGYKSTIVNCCNNFGPNQNQEKFIPTIIKNLRHKNKIPIYGKGNQIREWIYVLDFVRAIEFIILKKLFSEKFLIGSGKSLTNIKLADKIIKLLKTKFKTNLPKDNVKYVKDRPGHDKIYKVNSSKIRSLGWRSITNLDIHLEETIRNYLN